MGFEADDSDSNMQADIDIEKDAQERDTSPIGPRTAENVVANVRPGVQLMYVSSVKPEADR